MAKSKDTSSSSSSNRKAALDAALKQIDKQFGKGSIMKLGERTNNDIKKISAGSLLIDRALGGGYPVGRILEIYGPESSGKTTVALHAVAEVQKNGGQAAFIDAEHALDPSYAEKLGVNIDELLISQPDNGEQALEIVETLASSGAVDFIVVDSVAALVPKAEIEGEMGDSHMGLHARLMSQALRKISGVVSKQNCTVLFINQVREKIGVMFGNPETTTGGRALKFYASIRMEIRRAKVIKVGDETVGNETKVKVVKNKIAPPFKTCDTVIEYGKGISLLSEILTLGQDYNAPNGNPLIVKSGSWFSYTTPTGDEEKLGQGAENAKKFIGENKEVFEYLHSTITERMEEEMRPIKDHIVEEAETGEFIDTDVDEDNE